MSNGSLKNVPRRTDCENSPNSAAHGFSPIFIVPLPPFLFTFLLSDVYDPRSRGGEKREIVASSFNTRRDPYRSRSGPAHIPGDLDSPDAMNGAFLAPVQTPFVIAFRHSALRLGKHLIAILACSAPARELRYVIQSCGCIRTQVPLVPAGGWRIRSSTDWK